MDPEPSETENRFFFMLLQLFPKKDPEYLRTKALEFVGDESLFEEYVSSQVYEEDSYQEVPDQDLNQLPNFTQEDEEIKLPDWSFDIYTFLLKYPEPFEYFKNLKRRPEHKLQCLQFMKDRYKNICSKHLKQIITQTDYNLVETEKKILDLIINDQIHYDSESNEERPPNSPLLESFVDEVKLFENQTEIQQFLEIKEAMRIVNNIEGTALECECCFIPEFLENELITCTEGHLFCSSCVKKSTELVLGNNQLVFPCLTECKGEFTLKQIKVVLDASTYEKIEARIQEAEVRAAKIPGMEYCEFCEYAMIPKEGDNIFVCKKCKSEMCRKRNHIPLKCGETPQQDKEKRVRIQGEEVETRSVKRNCPTCKKSYVKDGGCNSMTCVCGASFVHT